MWSIKIFIEYQVLTTITENNIFPLRWCACCKGGNASKASKVSTLDLLKSWPYLVTSSDLKLIFISLSFQIFFYTGFTHQIQPLLVTMKTVWMILSDGWIWNVKPVSNIKGRVRSLKTIWFVCWTWKSSLNLSNRLEWIHSTNSNLLLNISHYLLLSVSFPEEASGSEW